MAKTAERTYQMMDNYMRLRNEGYSNEEIAKKYNLSGTAVRNRLQEIADKYGVSRESLLDKIHPIMNQEKYYKKEERRVHLNFETMVSNFDTATASVEGIIESIGNILDNDELEER